MPVFPAERMRLRRTRRRRIALVGIIVGNSVLEVQKNVKQLPETNFYFGFKNWIYIHIITNISSQIGKNAIKDHLRTRRMYDGIDSNIAEFNQGLVDCSFNLIGSFLLLPDKTNE